METQRPKKKKKKALIVATENKKGWLELGEDIAPSKVEQ